MAAHERARSDPAPERARPAARAPELARTAPGELRRLAPLLGNHAVATLVGRARVMRTPMSEARATVKADREYRAKTEQLEAKLGPYLSQHPKANAIADEMLTRLKKVVDAWADATKQDRTTVYGTDFAFPDGRNYYGSFSQTGENIKKILDDISHQPLRTKLNAVYYSLRGNGFAKWLEAAALELQAGGDVQVDDKEPGKTRTVKAGFAEQSGLKDVWQNQIKGPKVPGQLTPDQIAEIAKKRQGTNPLPIVGVKSDAMNSQEPVVKSRGDKVYDKAVGLTWEDQPTLTQADVADVTIDELKLLHEREGGDPSTIPESEWLVRQQQWKSKGTERVKWEMGVASIDIKPGSETRIVADKFRARLDAGISGSTDLMMHAGVHLGLTSKEQREALRLALVGWMLSNRDHSFYEIMLAAEGYGVPFARDEGKPGWEYEAEANFTPLSKSEIAGFKDLLPDGKMPSYYLSASHVKSIESSLPPVTTPEPATDKALLAIGVAETEVKDATPEMFLAHHEALREAIAAAAFQPAADGEHALRRNRVRMQALREHASFQWLALHHTSLDVYAERELVVRVADRYPDALVSAGTLKSGKVPDSVADAATPIQRLDLQRLVLAVTEAYKASTPPQASVLKTQLPYLGVKRFHADAEKLLDALLLAHKPVVII